MYEIKVYDDKFKIYEAIDSDTNSWFKVCPERGAIIISYGAYGEEKLYLDKDTFYDINSNIRGGIPILFPVCGRIENKEYVLNEKKYIMPNHGLARINKWEVVETGSKDCAFIKLSFKSDDNTKKSYPFDFEIIYTYILKEGKLSIEQEYKNFTEEEMPFYAGFHPYFKSNLKKLKYGIDATKYLDENDGLVKEFNGTIDLQGLVESPIFLDSIERKTIFKPCKDEKELLLTYGDIFKYVVIWSVDGKDFVCVEPWMGIYNSLNTGKDLKTLKNNESYKTFFNIEVVK